MAFDGFNWQESVLAYPSLYQPKSPLNGRSLSIPLKQAYVAARAGSRKVLEQNSPIDYRRPNQLDVLPVMIVSAFTPVAEAYRYLPAEMTHLHAVFVYALNGMPFVPQLQCRVLVSDGTNTDTGAAVTDYPPPGNVTQSATNLNFENPYPIVSIFDSRVSRRVECDVALSLVVAGAIRRIWIEARGINGVTTLGLAFQPVYSTVWWEIRD